MRTGPITKLRQELGFSMSEFAKLLDLALITLVKIERGISRIPLKSYLSITRLGLDFFQLTIDQENYIQMRRRQRGP